MCVQKERKVVCKKEYIHYCKMKGINFKKGKGGGGSVRYVQDNPKKIYIRKEMNVRMFFKIQLFF